MGRPLPALFLLMSLLFAAAPAHAVDEICECDRLSAHPFDPGRPPEIAGVPIEDLDPVPAIAACAAALDRAPGHPRLQFQLARGLFNAGRFDEALRFVRLSAEQGYAAAERNIGYLYYRGRILPQDDAAAFAWFRKAAEKGHALAQHDLGKMYERGHGAPRSNALAVVWYRKAAERMFTRAQHSLAYMYQAGTGVPKDRLEALKWFTIAARLGDDYSAWIGRLAALHMTPDEIATAQRMAQDWLATHGGYE